MNDMTAPAKTRAPASLAALPTPRTEVSIRLATMADLPFLDGLQKKFGRALGYFPTKQFEGYITAGHVLIAEARNGPAEDVTGDSLLVTGGASTPTPSNKYPVTSNTPLGYCISKDRYLKRDELGVIYQLCVAPGHQRGLIGATLVREVFQRSAYGCKLYCCWCAQDLPANHFWESMGFVPIAFRAGSDRKRRVHIFWQRRINAEDVSTPYWYPCATNGGAIREDRLVFPIPPGVHWSEVQAVAISDVARASRPRLEAKEDMGETPMLRKNKSSGETPKPRDVKQTISAGGLFFGIPKPAAAAEGKAKRARPPREKVKADPALVAKARELRDRYLEQVNGRLLIAPRGKYDVSRTVAGPASASPMRLLAAG